MDAQDTRQLPESSKHAALDSYRPDNGRGVHSLGFQRAIPARRSQPRVTVAKGYRIGLFLLFPGFHRLLLMPVVPVRKAASFAFALSRPCGLRTPYNGKSFIARSHGWSSRACHG
jgi:hypothetical protein